MSTPAVIGKRNPDKTITSISVHWDGYPEHTGKILKEVYNTPEKVDELLKLGNLSFLGTKLYPTRSDHTFDHPQKDVTIAYGRDRHEEGNEAQTYPNIRQWLKNSDYCYAYLFADNEWKRVSY